MNKINFYVDESVGLEELTITEYLSTEYYYHPDAFFIKHVFLLILILLTIIILFNKFRKNKIYKKIICLWIILCIITILSYFIAIPK